MRGMWGRERVRHPGEVQQLRIVGACLRRIIPNMQLSAGNRAFGLKKIKARIPGDVGERTSKRQEPMRRWIERVDRFDFER